MKYFLILTACICTSSLLFPQAVSVNNDGSAAHPSAMLDIKSTGKGFLAPRMNTTQRNAISSPAAGLMVYDTDVNSYYVYNGSAWNSIGSGGGSGWGLTGNAGTNPASNFIGTTDNTSLVFKIRNLHSGLIDSSRSNSSFGYRSLSQNTSGASNSAFGYKALISNTSGEKNTAVGNMALSANIDGTENTAVGYNALLQNIGGIIDITAVGKRNTAVGSEAMTSNTQGFENSAFGVNALKFNNGNFNSAFGSYSMLLNQTGSSNSAFGILSLFSNSTGYENAAFGISSLYNNNTGFYNSALGAYSLSGNTTGSYNTAMGYSALTNNQSGQSNTSIGYRSLFSSNGTVSNTAVGANSLEKNQFGTVNTAVGRYALYNNIGGVDNVAIGGSALYNNISGHRNVAIGNDALADNTTGYNNTAIGFGAKVLFTNLNNVTAIGANAVVGQNNSMVLGGIGQDAVNVGIGVRFPMTTLHVRGSAKIFAGGEIHTGNFWGGTSNVDGFEVISSGNDTYVGIQRTSGAALHIGKPTGANGTLAAFFVNGATVGTIFTNGTSTSYNTTSDFRLKENMKPTIYNLQTLMQIGVQDYNFIQDKNKTLHTGFVAQALHKIFPQAVLPGGDDEKTKPWMIDYGKLTPLLVKAVQEQQSVISKQQEQINILIKKVEALEKNKP